MFRLPTCPHCRTVYHYGEVRRAVFRKQEDCYHCKKSFLVSRKGIWLLLLILLAVCTIADIILFNVFPHTTVITVYIVNSVLAVTAFLLLPFFIIFRTNKTNKR